MGLLKGKRIVIIGGTSGIGLSSAQYFSQQGGHIIAVGLAQSDQSPIPNVIFDYHDAREEDTAKNAIALCHKSYGGFDALYHVAGGSGRKWGDGPLAEMTTEAWNETIKLNLDAVMYSNRAALQYFIQHKQPGSILNTSTVLANSPSPTYFSTHAYATAKAAIIGMSKATAAHYAKDNIRVNVLAPALTDTPMAHRAANNNEIQHFIKSKQPLDGGRMALAGDLDAAACYFLSDSSRFTTGQVLSIDGGWALSDGQIK